MTSQDFTKGVNFSVLSTADGTQHEQLIELAVPTADVSPEIGKGLNLITTDTALNVPDVPDAATTTKWKRYVWIRRPFAGATSKKPSIYVWNDDASSDATLLQWVLSNTDTEELTTLIDAAASDAANALAIANQAQITANDADATATAAETTATNASANATTAITAATNAISAAVAATSAAASASAAAANALGLASGNKNITQINPGLAGQKIRTKQDASVNEYFSDKDNYVKLSDTVVTTTAPQALTSAAGWQTRRIQTEDSDNGALCTLAANVITLKKGTYRVNINVTAISVQRHQARLRQTSGTPATLLLGTCSRADGNNVTSSVIQGVIVMLDDATTLEVQHNVSNNGDGGLVCGSGTNTENEVYLVVEFMRLD